MPEWKKTYPGFETLQLAVMGCIVNGPGKSKHADIGISLPGTGEVPAAPVYIDGKKVKTLRGSDIGKQFKDIVDDLCRRALGQATRFRDRGGVADLYKRVGSFNRLSRSSRAVCVQQTASHRAAIPPAADPNRARGRCHRGHEIERLAHPVVARAGEADVRRRSAVAAHQQDQARVGKESPDGRGRFAARRRRPPLLSQVFSPIWWWYPPTEMKAAWLPYFCISWKPSTPQ